MKIAIDPGTTESGYCRYEMEFDGMKIWSISKIPNVDVLSLLSPQTYDAVSIEMVASYGMPVGVEVFETVLWIGRFVQCVHPQPVRLIFRRQVKDAICHSPKANDASIRQALIDMYGGKEKAIGKKKTPGPLYGVSGDMWAALALAVTAEKTPEGNKCDTKP